MKIPIVLALFGLLLVYLEFFFPSGISVVIATGLLVGSIVIFAFQGYSWGWIAIFSILLLILVGVVCKIGLKHVKKKMSHQSDLEGSTAFTIDRGLIGQQAVTLSETQTQRPHFGAGKKTPRPLRYRFHRQRRECHYHGNPRRKLLSQKE